MEYIVQIAKLQSNRYHQQTNTQLFTGHMPFLSPNQQRQSTEGNNHHPTQLALNKVSKSEETRIFEQTLHF